MGCEDEDAVLCKNSAGRLSSPPIVVVEDSTQSFMTHNGVIHVARALPLIDQAIVEPLMIPLDVIMLRVFLHSVP